MIKFEDIKNNPDISVISGEVTDIPNDAITVIATGPLTSEPLADKISELTGGAELHFFDAAAPIVEKDSINFDIAYFGDRYGKGNNDYINLPMNKEQYLTFIILFYTLNHS